MIRPIMTKQFFLRQPSEDAGASDAHIVRDLVDTLEAHRATCAGMAANMVGERKRIIAVIDDDGSVLVMLNPRLTDRSGPYDAKEGCLSLEGVRPVRRYEQIAIEYDDELVRPCAIERSGRVAQAIQHEIDHCNGVLI